MTQNYGEGTIYRILQGYAKHGKNPWEKLFGKTFDGLIGDNGEGPHCDFVFCALIGCFLPINADFENLHSLSAAFMR